MPASTHHITDTQTKINNHSFKSKQKLFFTPRAHCPPHKLCNKPNHHLTLNQLIYIICSNHNIIISAKNIWVYWILIHSNNFLSFSIFCRSLELYNCVGVKTLELLVNLNLCLWQLHTKLKYSPTNRFLSV